MMRIVALFLSLMLCCSASNAAQQTSQVTMSLDEFEDIFSSARLENAERRVLDQRKKHQVEHERKLKELEGLSIKSDAEARRLREKIFPDNYQALHHTAKGLFNATAPTAGVERDVAAFDIELIIRMMDPKWTVIPIANTSAMVASAWELSWKADGGTDEQFELLDPVALPDVMMLRQKGQQVLATNRSGLFRVAFRAYARVSKTRSLNSLGMSSLLYPLSDFSIRIAADGNSGFIKDLSVQPSAAVLQVEAAAGYTDIKATLPLDADHIQIRWLDVATEDVTAKDEVNVTTSKEGSMNKKAKKGSVNKKASMPQTTAHHEVFHSVDEGIIRSTHNLDFKTSSDTSSLNSVQFSVHGEGVRVTSVVGHALQSWKAEEDTSVSATIVRVAFKSSHLDSTVQLQIHTEMDRGSPSSSVELPRVVCSNVLRQTGHIAIIKDANVEVHEQKISGLSRCDASEISSRLRLNTHRPIVLSYRYLNAENSIILNVTEHAPLDTLEATIDRLHYQAVVTETHTVHSMILIVQSTKLQYLELLGLHPTASRFSVLVNSVPTKPVEGHSEDGNSIQVPLLVGLNPEEANKGGSLKTSVEVTFFSSHETLGQNGTITKLAPPNLNLPISVLTAHLSLPKSYEYNFTGSFGRQPLDRLSYPIPSAFSFVSGTNVVKKGHKFTAVDDMWNDKRSVSEGTGGIKITTPRNGNSFYFERLLVIDEKLCLNATYTDEKPFDTTREKPFWSRFF